MNIDDLNKGYVVYNDKRHRIVGTTGETPLRMLRLRPFNGPDVMVSEFSVKPWKRSGVRHLKGKQPHRDKRPVHIDIDTGAEIIRAHLKGKRKRFECTFGGLYDLLARQEAMNLKRDRAFARRTKGRR